MKTRTTPATLTALALLAALLLPGGAATAAPELDGRTIDTGRHQITVGQNGLPDQLVIVPQTHELPLERRGGADVPDNILNALGRGPQLRDPMQLVATIQGKATPAEVKSAASPKAAGDEIRAESGLQAGPLNVELAARYTGDGAMIGTLTYSGEGTVEGLAIVAQLAGPVDIAIPGNPVGDNAAEYEERDFRIAGGEGVAWGNSKDDAEEAGIAAPGVLKHVYVGNGDRGFTLLTDGGDGWAIDPAKSMVALERDEQGDYTLHIRIINHETALKGKKTVEFALLTHPARARGKDFRDRQWTAPMKGDASTPELNLSAWAKANGLGAVRGDAVAFEGKADEVRVVGPAGVDLPKGAATVIDAYPLPLYRYVTGSHTGLARRIVPENHNRMKPGGNPKPDRSILGRALLHDAGLHLPGLANATAAMQSMNNLVEANFFDEQSIEFIPYWRTDDLLRFGPKYETDDPFALSTDNPFDKVKMSIYRRDAGDGRIEAMIVIANETDQPVRQMLYILDSERVFGGVNALKMQQILRRIDFEGIPKDSDWRPEQVMGGLPRVKGGATGLMDVETGGAVQVANVRDTSDTIYGNVFIPAHDFRVLYGYGSK